MTRKDRVALVLVFLGTTWLSCLTSPAGAQSSAIHPRVHGIVRDKTTKAPVADAVVHLKALPRDYSRQQGTLWWTTRTGPEGEFSFPAVEHYEYPGSFYVVACKNGYVSYPELRGRDASCDARRPVPYELFTSTSAFEKAIGVFRLGEEQQARLVIELGRGGALQGTLTVRTPDGMRPFLGNVALYRLAAVQETALTASELEEGFTVPNAEGQFAFRDLPPSDNYRLELDSPNFVREIIDGIQIRQDQVTQLERILDRTDPTGIRGQVRVGGTPAIQGRVTLRPLAVAPSQSPQDQCDADVLAGGSYECRGVAPGAFSVEFEVKAAPLQPWSRMERAVVIKQGETLSLNIDLPAVTPVR